VRRPRVCHGAAALLAATALAGAVAAPASAASTVVRVEVDRRDVALPIGRSFGFSSTLTNTGARATPELVAHLNVVGLDPDVYVDPEDWSSQRTRYLAPLRPGRSAKLRWNVKAVTGGSAAVYVVVLERRPDGGAAPVQVSGGRPISVRIAERRTLDSGGILPLALGLPALVGAVALVVRRVRRAMTSGRRAPAGAEPSGAAG
jgi:hypothetical protein